LRHRDDAVITQTLTISPRAGDTAEGYTMSKETKETGGQAFPRQQWEYDGQNNVL